MISTRSWKDMADNKGILCIGMALVDSIIKGFDPEPVSATGFRAASGSLNVGGEAVNEAMAASKLGQKTAIMCALGNDAAGDTVLSALDRNGVDTHLVIRGNDHSTPVTTMFVNDDGTRKSITNTAHRYNFHPERYTKTFEGFSAVILGSLFRAPFDDPDIITAVLKDAKRAGLLTAADTKLPNFKVLTLDDIAKALPYADYITPNEDEARYYTGKNDPSEMAKVFLDHGVKNVVIKLGSRGCYFENRDRSIRLDACDIEAVDATGAGDNFVAGLVSRLLDGDEPEDALVFANACGAICTTAVGADTALKNKEQVMRFIKENVTGRTGTKGGVWG